MANDFKPLATLGAALTEVRQKFPDAQALAEFCWPHGSTLRCRTCKVSRPCPVTEIAEIISHGYPICKKCSQKTELD